MSIPIPPDLARGRVSWTVGRTDGTTLPGARGTVRFEATAVAVTYSTATVLPAPVETPVVAGVMTPVDLLVNDPGVWNWKVTPRLGVVWESFHIDVDGPVDLATAAVVPGKGPIRAVKGVKGDPGTATTITQVTGLQAALNGKTDTTDPRLTNARPPTAHEHALDDVTGLTARLAALEYDSGWRDVSADLRLGATGVLHIRRVGLTVYWRFNGLAPGTAHAFYWPPDGMIAAQPGTAVWPEQSTADPVRIYLDVTGRICRTYTAPPIPAGAWWTGSYTLAPGTPPPAASWNPPPVA